MSRGIDRDLLAFINPKAIDIQHYECLALAVTSTVLGQQPTRDLKTRKVLYLFQDGRLPLPQAILNRGEFRDLSLPFGIDIKGRDISVLIKFAIAAANKILTAVAGNLLPVVVIPTRVFDVTNIAGLL